MKVKDKMKEPLISIPIDKTIYEAAKIMKKYNIGFLPIHDQEKIVGVLTDRDITTKCIANEDEYATVKNYMQTSLVYIDEDKDIDIALALMGREKVKRLLVTKNQKVIGVLSLSNILDYNDQKVIQTIKQIFQRTDTNISETAEIDEFYL